MSAPCSSCRFWVRHASEEPITGMCRSRRLRKSAQREAGGPIAPYVITWNDDSCQFHTERVAEVPDAEEGD